jgi:nucleoside-diphosphate-sugar epimerase
VNVLQIGCGYLGEEVRRGLAEAGAAVTVITRETADVGDRASLERALADREFQVALHCASSSRGGEEAYRHVFLEGARNLAELLPGARLLLTSSTSVYGQTDGGLVDEDAPADPASVTSKILREAEEIVLARGGIVARLAGLYGPGRWAALRKLREGQAVIEDGGRRVQNHLHRDDAASALVLLASRGVPDTIYNVVDDLPMEQGRFYRILCAATGLPYPPPGVAPGGRKRGTTSKQVSNRRLRELGWQPRYPGVEDALREDARLLEV